MSRRIAVGPVVRPVARAARPVGPERRGQGIVRAEGPSVVDAEGGVVTLRLYDCIDAYGGWWGMSAGEFATVLDGVPRGTKEIRLHINSPGGDVFEGIAILNALRQHPAKITTVVDGLAASIASVIALAGDEMLMAPNSEFMIHEAWGGCLGNAADMRKLADVLDHISDNIAAAYATRAGGEVAHWRALMAEETWFNADETVTAGLADRIADPRAAPTDAPAVAASFDRSAFKYRGRAVSPDPAIAETPASHKSSAPAAVAREQAARVRARLRKVAP